MAKCKDCNDTGYVGGRTEGLICPVGMGAPLKEPPHPCIPCQRDDIDGLHTCNTPK